MSWVLRDALLYNLSGDAALREDLRSAVHVLSKAAETVDDKPRSDIENVLAHVAIILTQKSALDRIVAGLISPQSADRIDAVTQHYNAAFMQLEDRAAIFQSLLFVLSVLTVLYVVFVLMQLNRAAASLEAANVELEERVAARTSELSDTNSRLRVHLDRIGQAMERAERGDLDIQLPEDVEGGLRDPVSPL